MRIGGANLLLIYNFPNFRLTSMNPTIPSVRPDEMELGYSFVMLNKTGIKKYPVRNRITETINENINNLYSVILSFIGEPQVVPNRDLAEDKKLCSVQI